MPTLKDFNARNRRESLSLFEDESRSHCTVEEAQAYQQTLARARRRRALMVVIPLLAALVGVGIYLHLRAKAAAREQARHEEEEKQQMASPQERSEGLESARLVIRVQGPSEDALPPQVSYVVQQAFWQKPSEVRVVRVLGGMMNSLPFALTLNGEEEIPVRTASGEEITLHLSDRRVDAQNLADGVSQYWNRLYPEALHPMKIEIPKAEESPYQRDEKKKLEGFQKMPQLDDPRMSNPSDH